MSVVLLIRSLRFGGAERQLVELAKGLHARGLRVLVLVFYAGGPLLDELASAGVPVKSLDKRGRWDLFVFFARLVREVRRARPQVIYSFLVEPGIVAAALKPLVPRLRVIWGVLASNVDFGVYDWPTRASFRVSSWFARLADLIVVNSTVAVDFHARHGYPRAKMVFLPSGVDVLRFAPDTHAGLRMRDAWGIPPSDKVVGVVGRLDPMKDHATLFEAAAVLGRSGLRPWLVCVGTGQTTYVESLRTLAQSFGLSDRVVWAGTHSDMAAVYNAFDIVCSSSAFGEGWSNALGEAMACGVPCVATDLGDARSILGDLGVLVPPKDPQRLAEGIHTALTRVQEEVKRACRERIVDLFGTDRMVVETERLMRMSVDERRA